MNYYKDIQDEAQGFMQEYQEEIIEALVDDVGTWESVPIQTVFREKIAPSLTFNDAVTVLDETENLETDDGLWDGWQPKDAVVLQAYYSYQADVFAACDKLYTAMQETFVADVDNDATQEEQRTLAHRVFINEL